MNDNYSRRNAFFAMAVMGGGAVTAGLLLEPASAKAQVAPTYYPPGNIQNFGADPNGLVDSSTAINNAINALWNSDTGCAIYVPAGKYLISQPIIFKTKMKLYGDGISSVIKCNFDSETVTPVVAVGALSLTPMICNTSKVSWWSIQDLQFDGQNKNVYGAWFAQAYYGSMRNVYFFNTGSRPYTAIQSNFINHSHVVFYGCGDGVICWNCTGFSMDTVSFEGNKGAYSFQWRAANGVYGSLDMRNIWLENTSTHYNTIAYLGLGGISVFGRSFLAANNSLNRTLQAVHFFDEGDSIIVDGLSLTTIAAHGLDLGQITDLANMFYYFGKNSVGNAISGHIHLDNVIQGGNSILYKDIGSSSNGVLAHAILPPNGTQPNFVTSL